MINSVEDVVFLRGACLCSKCEMSNNLNDKHYFADVVGDVCPFWVKIRRAFQDNFFFKAKEIILYLKYEVGGFFLSFEII